MTDGAIIRKGPFAPGDHAEAGARRGPETDMFARVGQGLFYLLCFSLAFMRPAFYVGSLAAIPTDILAAGAIGCWIAAGARDRRYRRWDPMFVVLLLYLLVMVVTAVFADRPFRSFTVRLASEAYLVVLPMAIYGLMTEERHLRRASRAWLAGTTVILVLLVVALVVAAIDPRNPLLRFVQHHRGSLPLGPFVRYKLAFNNPNMLGAYLSASLLIVLLAADRRWIAPRAAVALVAGIAMALIATFSAGIGGGILAGGIWYWLKRRDIRPRRAWSVLGLAGIVALAFVMAQALTPVGYADPLFAVTVPGTGVTLVPASRLQVWIDTVRTFLAHPLTGVGMGTPVAHVRFVEPSGKEVYLTDGHNVLLDLAAECGVLGAVAIVAIVATIWRRTRPLRIDVAARNLPAIALGIGVLDVLVYQGIGGGFENARFVWVMIGLLLVAAKMRRRTVGADAP